MNKFGSNSGSKHLPGRLISFFLPPYKVEMQAFDLLALVARLIFLVTLFYFFWSSAMTKFDGFLQLSSGAYYQIFPKAFERAGYDATAMSFWQDLVVYAGSLAEVVLPILIVIGLLTRLSALAMIGFIIVMSITDVWGHGVEFGQWMDNSPYGLIADQRLYWLLLLLILFIIGGGWLSLDKLIEKARR